MFCHTLTAGPGLAALVAGHHRIPRGRVVQVQRFGAARYRGPVPPPGGFRRRADAWTRAQDALLRSLGDGDLDLEHILPRLAHLGPARTAIAASHRRRLLRRGGASSAARNDDQLAADGGEYEHAQLASEVRILPR